MITSMRLLNPYFALGTLFKFASPYELQKLLIVFIGLNCAAEFSTTFTSVKRDHAAEAIMFFAGFTFKFTAVCLVKDKSILAVRRWTPTHIC